MIFIRWDAAVFDCLAREAGRRLTSLLPQPRPVPSGALERDPAALAKAGAQPWHLLTRASWVFS